MPEKTLIDAALAGDKTPPASGDPETEPSKDFVTQSALDEALERVSTQVAETVTKAVGGQVKLGLQANRQSANATIDNRVTGMQSELVSGMRALLPEGVDFDKLQDEAWIRSQRKKSQEPESAEAGETPQAEPAAPASVESTMATEIASILQKHGLSGNEPELVEYVKANKEQPWYLAGAGFNELAEKIAGRQSDPANIMGTGSGTPPNPNLKAKYLDEVAELRAQGKYDRSSQVAMREIAAKYEKLGLKTSEIDLLKEFAKRPSKVVTTEGYKRRT